MVQRRSCGDMMNTTFVVLLSSLLMGTSFLQELPPNPEEASSKQAQSEPTSYLSAHPLLTGAAALRGGCANNNHPHRGQQLPEEDEEYPPPFGGRPPRRRQTHQGYLPSPPNEYDEECQVRFGLHYSSCFSKYKDFDDKFDQLQHHVQSLPRGTGGNGGGHSPCSTLQLLAKVKSSPLFDRCHGNQYLLRTPYQMYNVKGELRYIVQDPPNLEQCYLEASCSIPSDVCRSYGYGPSRREGCEARHCHHTLLAWDPARPDAGTFFDIFEYSCCCHCLNAPTPSRSSQIGG